MPTTLYTPKHPCIAGTSFTFPAHLFQRANGQLIQTSPTLAAGDVKISKDGAGYDNITTLPVEVETSGELTVILAALETTGATKYISVKFSDVAGAEWCDTVYVIGMDEAKSVASDVALTVALSATQAAAISTGALALAASYTLRQTITSTLTSDLSAATKLWLSIKMRKSDVDALGLVFIEKSAGITVVNQTAYATTTNGSLTVSGSSGAWVVDVFIDEAATALLFERSGTQFAELKALIGGDALVVWSGTCVITDGIVRSIA